MPAWPILFALCVASGCAEEPEERLRVVAASSLADALAEVNASYGRAPVDASYVGSQIGRMQIAQGAPVDVFASANAHHVEALFAAGLVERPVAFAETEMVVIVPDRAGAIERFEDLPSAERIVLARPEVPAGAYTREVLRHAGRDFADRVRARVVSEESNVRLVRAKVELGEADAAIVYRSDAIGARLRVVPIPHRVRATYHVAVVATSSRRDLARGWIAHLRGPEGSATLRRHGFEPTR